MPISFGRLVGLKITFWNFQVGPISTVSLGVRKSNGIGHIRETECLTYLVPVTRHVGELNVLNEVLKVRVEFQCP